MAKRNNSRVRNEITRTAALDLLRSEIEASSNGSVITSSSRLAERVGRAPQTVATWISGWTKAGLIAVERLPGSKGIRVSLPGDGLVLPFPVAGSSGATSEGTLTTDLEGTEENSVEAIQEATSDPVSGAADATNEASTSGATTKEAKVVRKRRPAKRRPANPDLDIAVQPSGQAISVQATTPAPASVPAILESPRVVPESVSHGTLLGWTLRTFTLAAIALSVGMVAMHVAGAEDSDPAAYWSLVLASILVSLLKPVLGTVAERLWSQGSYVAATMAFTVALGALAYDATNLWAFRGSGLEDKAVTTQAQIDARSRNQTKLDGLLAEQKRLTSEEPPRPAGVISAEIVRVHAEAKCKPVKVSRRSSETTIPASCTRAVADLEAEKAKAERVEALVSLIEEATKKLETRPVHADAHGGAKAAASTINWVSQGILGGDVATAQGVQTGWSLAFVLLIEIVAVMGFALAAMVERTGGR